MDRTKNTKILEVTVDTLEYVRSKYNLNDLERRDEAIDILDEWIKSQPHLKKKDFPRNYLETAIIARKGSLERAKVLMDNLCTLRSLMPDFFEPVNIATDLGRSRDNFSAFFPRKMSKDYCRFFFLKVNTTDFNQNELMMCLKYFIVVGEYLRLNDCVDGIRFVLDISGLNLVQLAANLDLLMLRKLLPILQDGFGMRLFSIHIISESTLVARVVGILKQILSAKLFSRLHCIKHISAIYDLIDRTTLPKEYGGEEHTIQEFKDLWIQVLSSEEHLQHLREMSEANTDESLRVKGEFNEHYAGVPGTFRFLKVD